MPGAASPRQIAKRPPHLHVPAFPVPTFQIDLHDSGRFQLRPHPSGGGSKLTENSRNHATSFRWRSSCFAPACAPVTSLSLGSWPCIWYTERTQEKLSATVRRFEFPIAVLRNNSRISSVLEIPVLGRFEQKETERTEILFSAVSVHSLHSRQVGSRENQPR